MELGPDLIVSAGAELVDPLAVVSGSHLDRRFLIVGAQLPEPTANVTAAVWDGASSRGSEVADSSTSFDPTRHARASRRRHSGGRRDVLSGITGIVIWLG